MKKIITMLMSLILAATMCVSVFSGCALVQKNNTRDMNQVVATVKIGEDAPKDEIYKRDVVIMYVNYGYQFVQSYGWTVERTIQYLLDALIDNRILAQKACEVMYDALSEEDKAKITEKYDADNYLTDDMKAEALYNTNKAFNDIIDSYIQEEDEAEKEDYSETVRTTPTGAQVAADKKELVKADWDEYNTQGPNKNGILTGYGEERDNKRIAAYNKTIESLKNNSLLGEDFNYQKDDITASDYYKTNLKNNKESQLLNLYNNNLRLEALKHITFDGLSGRYAQMYEAQKAKYDKSAADYLTDLGNVNGDTTRVVYNPYEGYGYVYNILLGVDSIQSAEITDLTAKLNADEITKAEYRAEREKLLARTVVKDQRATWVINNYDYDFTAKTFGEDYGKYPFQGDVTWLNEKDKPADDADQKTKDEYKPEYKVNYLKEFSLKEFLVEFENYVYNGISSLTNVGGTEYFAAKDTAVPDAKLKEFRSRIDDIVFAYSTDPGALNSLKGYTSAPIPAIDDKETYVEEFAYAARDVLEKGVGSYVMVATDFGYHLMVCSEKITAGDNYETLIDYVVNGIKEFNSEAAAKEAFNKYLTTNEDDLTDEEKETYLYKFFNAYVSSYVSDNYTAEQDRLKKEYREDETKVKVYKDRYSDLK